MANTIVRYPPDLTPDSRRIPYTKFRMIKYRERLFVKDRTKFKEISSETSAIGTVIMPLPENINNSNNLNWEMTSLQGVKLLEKIFEGSTGGKGVLGAGADIAALYAPQISKIAAQKTPNPKKQALFNGIEPRTFSFTYTFSPQSRREAEELEKMIKLLTVNILPATSDLEITGPVIDELEDRFIEAAFFQFPAEFLISFHNVEGFPKPRACVCTNISTNYSPTTVQLLESGHSVQIALSLSFLETELLRSSNPGV